MFFSSKYATIAPQTPFVAPFHSIIPHLYIGSEVALKSASLFDYIVNCTRHIPLISTIPSIRVAVNDHHSESSAFIQSLIDTNVIEMIHEQRNKGKNVLVHCHAGIQRSCTIVALYLMKYYGMSAEEVIRFIQTKRPIAFQPQPTFKKLIYAFYAGLGKV
jgi:hypothetical protein